MSLGYTTGFKVFEAATTLGKREGYYHGRQSIGSSGQRISQCAGGEPNVVTESLNQMPALANGSIKKLVMSIYVNGGGRLDCYSKVAGVAILRGDVQSIEKKTFDFDHAFLKDDIITWQFQRNNSNGTLDYGCFSEIEWSEDENIKHWYGGLYRGGHTSNTFWQIGEMSRFAIFPLTNEVNFKTPMQLSGTILDYGWYGTMPVSADNTPLWDLRKNGVSVVTNTLTQGGGRIHQNFVGVNVPFAIDDDINFMGRSSSGITRMEGFPTMRVRFDID